MNLFFTVIAWVLVAILCMWCLGVLLLPVYFLVLWRTARQLAEARDAGLLGGCRNACFLGEWLAPARWRAVADDDPCTCPACGRARATPRQRSGQPRRSSRARR